MARWIFTGCVAFSRLVSSRQPGWLETNSFYYYQSTKLVWMAAQSLPKIHFLKSSPRYIVNTCFYMMFLTHIFTPSILAPLRQLSFHLCSGTEIPITMKLQGVKRRRRKSHSIKGPIGWQDETFLSHTSRTASLLVRSYLGDFPTWRPRLSWEQKVHLCICGSIEGIVILLPVLD